MKAVIFTRVSSERQEGGHSLNAQLKRLQEYCEKRKFYIIDEFEVSESSTIGDRKKFHEMITFIKAERRKIKSRIALICDSVDRLQRGFRECPLIDDLMQTDVIEIHFYKEGFFINKDSSSTDILRWDMAVLFAKSYVSSLSESVRRGNKYAWEKGLWTGKIPIGYKKITENNKSNFLPDEPSATYVKKLFEAYATGLESLKSLEEKCKEWNLVSPQSKTGKTICRNTVARILEDPFYYGEMYIKKYKKYYPHNYETLIDRWLFEKCKEVRTGKTTNQPKQSDQISTKKSFIFANLIKCKTTNRVVTCDDPINRHGKQYIYLMPWKPENPKKKMYVREDKVLKQIEWVFDSMTIKSEKLKQEMNEYLRNANNSEKEHHENEAKMLDKQIRYTEQQENFWIDKYGDPNRPKSITEEIINKKLEELDIKKSKLKEQRERLEIADKNTKTHIFTAFKLISNASLLFKNSKTEQKRQLINFVFSNLFLEGENLHYCLRKPFDKLVNLTNQPLWRTERDSNPRFLL